MSGSTNGSPTNGKRFWLDIAKKVAVWAALGTITIVIGGIVMLADTYVGNIAAAQVQPVEAKVDEAVAKAQAAVAAAIAAQVALETHKLVKRAEDKAEDDRWELLMIVIDPSGKKLERAKRKAGAK